MKKGFLRVCLFVSAVLFGALVGSITAVFLQILYRVIEFLWHEPPTLISPTGEIPYYTLILGITGGLLVGLCHKYLGDHPQLMQDSIADFRKTNRFEYGHIWQGVVTAGTSLLFGASLGPEAALMDLDGGSALGLAISVLLPAVSPVVAIVGGMAGSTVAVIRQPIAVVILLLLFFPLKLVGVMVVAALVGLLIARPFALPPGQIAFGRSKAATTAVSTD